MNAPMPVSDPLPLAFFASGIRARLGEDGGRCWFEVALQDGYCADAAAVLVEVLARPRDRDGLPQGLPCVVFSERWPLEPTSTSGQQRSAFGWFPRAISPAAARQCHYRVTLVTILDQQSG